MTDRTAPIIAAVCDLNGILRGKRMAAQALGKLEAQWMRLPLSSVGVDIWGTDATGSRSRSSRAGFQWFPLDGLKIFPSKEKGADPISEAP